MPTSKLPTCYWDSSVVIMALEGQGNYPPAALAAAAQIISLAEVGKMTIVTSQIVVTEVLPSRSGAEAMKTFRGWLRWRSLQVLPVDASIVHVAADLRDRSLKLHQKKWLPDVIHAATALSVAQDLNAVHAMDGDIEWLLGLWGSSLPCGHPQPVNPQLILTGQTGKSQPGASNSR